MAKKAQKKYTLDDLAEEIQVLDRVTNALNTAVVAIAYATKVKGTELDKVNDEQYVKFVSEHVHPLVRRADQLVADTIARKEKEIKEGDKDGQ